MKKRVEQVASVPDPKTNKLLAAMTPEDCAVLVAESTTVAFKLGKRLLQPDDVVTAVYFPLNCMVSLLAGSDPATPLELATIGREGVVGMAEVLHNQGAMGMHLIQIPGNALRVEAEAFRRAVERLPLVEKLMQRHFYALTRQILQGAMCNRRHSMEERCARWLLMTQDRAGENVFPLTQEFLSRMLGVRRATVNVATGMLKKAGFIKYVRGVVTVIDRPGLESASCECYMAIVKQYDSILSEPYQKI